MKTFIGLVTADGYQRMLSTLESDPKVQSISEYDPPLLLTHSAGAKLVPLNSRTQTSWSVVIIGWP